MKNLILILVLAVAFIAVSCTVNIAINVNAPGCSYAGSTNLLTSSCTAADPTCEWCFSNCSSTCPNTCACTAQKCLANQTRYEFYGQLFQGAILQGYIELVAYDNGGDNIVANGTLFTFQNLGSGAISFVQYGSGTPITMPISNINSVCGASPFPSPSPSSFKLSRDALYCLANTTTQVNIAFATLTVSGAVFSLATNPSPSIIGAASLVASSGCVDLTAGVSVGTTTCANLNGIFVDLQSDSDCGPATARVVCYTGSASAAKFSPCTTASAAAACQQVFPNQPTATSVFQTSANCLGASLNPTTRYLCVIPN